MHIVDPIAIRDIPSDMNLLLHITNAHTGRRTVLQRNPATFDENPIKIVTGRQNCAILECNQAKTASVYDFLEGVNRYYEFTELRPYTKNGVKVARFLFFDGPYLRDHLFVNLCRIDDEVQVEYGLAAVTLVGDGMARASGIAASTYEAIREKHPDLVILDGDIQRPTSSILMIIREQDKDRCVSAIHHKRIEINRRSLG
jgi:aspartate kinase